MGSPSMLGEGMAFMQDMGMSLTTKPIPWSEGPYFRQDIVKKASELTSKKKMLMPQNENTSCQLESHQSN